MAWRSRIAAAICRSAGPSDALRRHIAARLSQVSRDDIVERSLAHFQKADADYGRLVTEAVSARRKGGGGQAMRTIGDNYG